MLKILALILSIYVLVLTGMPCCAYACKQEGAKKEQSQPKEHKQEKDCDNCTCSPFFSCQNCGGFVVQPAINIPKILIHTKDPVYNIYKQNSYQEYITHFWQPPRTT